MLRRAEILIGGSEYDSVTRRTLYGRQRERFHKPVRRREYKELLQRWFLKKLRYVELHQPYICISVCCMISLSDVHKLTQPYNMAPGSFGYSNPTKRTSSASNTTSLTNHDHATQLAGPEFTFTNSTTRQLRQPRPMQSAVGLICSGEVPN